MQKINFAGIVDSSIFLKKYRLTNIDAIFVFTVFAPLIMIISFLGIFLSTNIVNAENVLGTSDETSSVLYTATAAELPIISGSAKLEDARVPIVSRYLKKNKSPLEPYAHEIVEVANQHGVDFRLIVAIARQESNLCKFIPENTYNCWGWGIHSQGTLGFESYEEGIRTVTEGIKRKYIDEGLTTPVDIMGKYTPSSNGSWASAVTQFMEEMQ